MNTPITLRNPGACLLLFSIVFSSWFSQGITPHARAQAESSPRTPAIRNLFLPLVASSDSSQPPPPAQGGLFALTDWLTYNGDSAVDVNGGVHFVFYTSDERHPDEKRNQPAYYAYCAGPVNRCADGSQWTGLVQLDVQVNEVQIVLTQAGQPRILTRTNGNRGYDYHFWACDTQCPDGQNWAGLFVTNAAGVELRSADMPQHSFALDSQDRPRFVYGNGWGNGRPTAIYYAFCDVADCTEAGSWQEVNIWGPVEGKTTSADYATLRFAGDQPRVLTRLTYSGLPVSVEYYACDQACDQHDSWGSATIAHPDGDRQWASWDLALDANGQPRVALYEPANVDIQVTGRLFYGWCDNDCTGEGSPFQLVQVANGEGESVDLEIDHQGRSHLVYDAGQRGVLGHLWCDVNCTATDGWQRRILESNEQLMTEFAPASPFTCDQMTRAWLDAIPSLTLDSQGKLVVAYDVKNVATCYYTDPADPQHPVISRVERIWWAVRWAYFSQP
jgi:hypothetical protein